MSGRARAKSRSPPRSHHDAGLTIMQPLSRFKPLHAWFRQMRPECAQPLAYNRVAALEAQAAEPIASLNSVKYDLSGTSQIRSRRARPDRIRLCRELRAFTAKSPDAMAILSVVRRDHFSPVMGSPAVSYSSRNSIKVTMSAVFFRLVCVRRRNGESAR